MVRCHLSSEAQRPHCIGDSLLFNSLYLFILSLILVFIKILSNDYNIIFVETQSTLGRT